MALINRFIKGVFGASPEKAAEPHPTAPRTFEEQVYVAVVMENDVCYDVGANIGVVSLLLSRLVGRAGLVVAFEPVILLYTYLCTCVQAPVDPRATIITLQIGLADTEMSATVQVPTGLLQMGSLAPSQVWSEILDGVDIRSYPCRFTTLDVFVQTSGIARPDFIKIDVEGAELLVLRGAETMFREGHRPLLLLELFGPWEQAFGYVPWDVLSLLMNHGYRFLFLCPQGLVEHVPTAEMPLPPEYEGSNNVLAYCAEVHAHRIEAAAGLRAGGATRRMPMNAEAPSLVSR